MPEPYPDYVGAVMDWIRELPELAAIQANMPVRAELAAAPQRAYGVLVLPAGGEGKHPDLPTYTSLTHFRFYGPNALSAAVLYRALFPRLAAERGNGFVRRGCVVMSITPAGGYVPLVEDNGSPFVLQPANVRWRTTPAPADRVVN